MFWCENEVESLMYESVIQGQIKIKNRYYKYDLNLQPVYSIVRWHVVSHFACTHAQIKSLCVQGSTPNLVEAGPDKLKLAATSKSSNTPLVMWECAL